MIKNFLLVACGGGIGSMARYALSLMIGTSFFPVATLLINVAGSFAIGVIMACSYRSDSGLDEPTKLFLATGICGGFTSFSAFSQENITMMQAGRTNLVAIYIIASVAFGILGAWIGYKFMNS